MKRSSALVPVLVLAGLSAAPAIAQDHTLSIGVAGEKFKLDPQFTIAIDGTVIGEGSVGNALDTTAGEVMRAAADPAALVVVETFPIPAALLSDGAVVTVTFSGGSYDQATGADTNLYIASLEIDGRPLALESAKLADGANPDGAIMLVGGMLGLYANGATASFTLDAAEALPEPAVAEAPAPAVEKAKPAPVVEPEVAAAPEPVATPEPVCITTTTLDIVGFGNNGLTLADDAKADLDALAAILAGQDCLIDITGYASTSGGDSANERISLARAELVGQHLTSAGIDAGGITVTGAGETRQFGDAQENNRRVVVSVAATR